MTDQGLNFQLTAQDQAAAVVEALAGKFGNLVKSALTIGAIAAPVIAVTKTLQKMADMAAQEEVGVVKMNAALKASFDANAESIQKTGNVANLIPGTWDQASSSIEKYMAARLKTTALDDGEGREAIQRLVESTGDYRKALEVMPLVQDLAAAKGMSLATSGMLIGRVMQGNTGILARYGIQLGKGATVTEALGALQKRFGGQAEAYAKTYEGSQKRLEIAWGNIQETIGGALLPKMADVAGGFADILTEAIPVAEMIAGKLTGAIQDAGMAIYDFSEQAEWLPKPLRSILSSFGEFVGGAGSFQDFWGVVTKEVTGAAKVISEQAPLLKGSFENMLAGVRVSWQPLATMLEAIGVSPEVAAKAAGVAASITGYIQDGLDKVKLAWKEGGISGIFELMRQEAVNAWPKLLGAFDTLRTMLMGKIDEIWGGRAITDEFGIFLGRVGGLRDTLGGLGVPETVLQSFDNFLEKIRGFSNTLGEAVKLLQGGEFRGAMEALGIPEITIRVWERLYTAISGMLDPMDGIASKGPGLLDIVGKLLSLVGEQALKNFENLASTLLDIDNNLTTLSGILNKDVFPALETLAGKASPVSDKFNDIASAFGTIIEKSPGLTAFFDSLGKTINTFKDLVLNPLLLPLTLINEALKSMIGLYEAVKGLGGGGGVAPPVSSPGPGAGQQGHPPPAGTSGGYSGVSSVVVNQYNYDPDAGELARRGTLKALQTVGAG